MKYTKVTLGGLAGTGTSTVGKLLEKAMAAEFVSGGGQIRQLAAEMNLSLEDFHQLRQKDPQYDERLDEMQMSLGQNDRLMVIESRMGWHFVQHPKTLRVLLTCYQSMRQKRVFERDRVKNLNLTLEQVISDDLQRLKDDKALYAKMYGVEDYLDPAHYDLVIDTTYLDARGTATIIMTYVAGTRQIV